MLRHRTLALWHLVLLLAASTGFTRAALPPAAEAEIRRANGFANALRTEEALQAVDRFLKELGNRDYRGDSSYVEGLAVAARICNTCGDPRKGLGLATKALESASALQPENPHVTGLALVSAASCHLSLGAFDEAREESTRAWEVLGRVRYRPDVPNLIPRCHSMVRLASHYNEIDDAMMAEKYYRLAADDARRLMKIEPQGPQYDLGKFAASGRALSSLGGFYVQSGDHRRAVPLILQSLEIRKRIGPSSMPGQTQDLEASYISLARAYVGLGEYDRATRYIDQAIQSALRTNHLQRLFVAKSVVASIQSDQGNYDEALATTGEVLEILRKIRNNPDLQHPSLLNNAGWISLLKGEFDRAKTLLTKAYQTLVESGDEDPNLNANILFSLAMVEFLQDNPDRGLMGLQKAHALYEEEIDRLVGFGSDSQKLAYLQKQRPKTNFVLGLAFGKYREHEEFSREAWLTVVRRKGRMTRLLQQSARLLQEGVMTRTEREELKEARARLSLLALSLGIVSREGASEFDQDWMIELEEIERGIQRKLAAKSGVTGASSEVSLARLQSALDADEAVIEYVVYRPFRHDLPKARASTVPRRCGVFVMNADGKMKAYDLGEYREIQLLAMRFRKSLATPGDPSFEDTGKDLYARLIAPLQEIAGEATQWRIAPDGQLGMIPFGALPNAEGQLLESEVELSYLANAGELLESKTPVKNAGRLTIFAGPEYSLDQVRPTAASVARGLGPKLGKFLEDVSEIGAPLQFQALPGTLQEAEALAELFPGASVIKAEEATEASFAGLEKGGLLHLATHGFYLNEDLISSNEKRGLKRIKDPQPLGLESIDESQDEGNWIGRRSLDHPLLNCGLVFSGANQLFDGKDDGIMTGMEVLNLDLRGTDLLVLSACETGVGEVVTGEGVLGLNQAFRVAGASSLVTSLWKVNDEATAALMTAFYAELTSGTSKGEALRRAKAKIRGREGWSHPSYSGRLHPDW